MIESRWRTIRKRCHHLSTHTHTVYAANSHLIDISGIKSKNKIKRWSESCDPEKRSIVWMRRLLVRHLGINKGNQFVNMINKQVEAPYEEYSNKIDQLPAARFCRKQKRYDFEIKCSNAHPFYFASRANVFGSAKVQECLISASSWGEESLREIIRDCGYMAICLNRNDL